MEFRRLLFRSRRSPHCRKMGARRSRGSDKPHPERPAPLLRRIRGEPEDMPRKAREIPWLDKRGDQYYACWYDGGAARTRRLSLRTTDAREARGRFAAWLVECEDEYAGDERKQPADRKSTRLNSSH